MSNLQGARRTGRFGAVPLPSLVSAVVGTGAQLIQRPADLDASATLFVRVESGSARIRPQSNLGGTNYLVANSTPVIFGVDPGVRNGDGPFRVNSPPPGWDGITTETDLFYIAGPVANQFFFTPSREEAVRGDSSNSPQTTSPFINFNAGDVSLWGPALPATASSDEYSSVPLEAGDFVSLPAPEAVAISVLGAGVVTYWWA